MMHLLRDVTPSCPRLISWARMMQIPDCASADSQTSRATPPSTKSRSCSSTMRCCAVFSSPSLLSFSSCATKVEVDQVCSTKGQSIHESVAAGLRTRTHGCTRIWCRSILRTLQDSQLLSVVAAFLTAE